MLVIGIEACKAECVGRRAFDTLRRAQLLSPNGEGA